MHETRICIDISIFGVEKGTKTAKKIGKERKGKWKNKTYRIYEMLYI